MHEGPRQLDQAFVIISRRSMTILQPEFLKDVMRFVELLLIEAIEIAGIVRIEISSREGANAFCYRRTFLAHAESVSRGKRFSRSDESSLEPNGVCQRPDAERSDRVACIQ